MLEFGIWEVRERETVCPCWHGRKLCKHLADEDSPWPYALNSCRKTGLLSPEGQDTQREREAGGVRVKWQRGTWAGKGRRQKGNDGGHKGEEMWANDPTKNPLFLFLLCYIYIKNSPILSLILCFQFIKMLIKNKLDSDTCLRCSGAEDEAWS